MGSWIVLDDHLAIYKSGKVKDVVEKQKLGKNSRITGNNIAGKVDSTKAPVLTAASRASDAKADLEWEE